MKKLGILIIIILIFLFGITLGGNFNKSSIMIFEENKEYFENEISKPNNNYLPKELVPKKNVVNNTANKLEGIIDSTIEKLFSFLS